MGLQHKLCVVLIIFTTGIFLPFGNYGPELSIHALDVGQGDSTLIITPSQQRILIDGGPDSTVIDEIDKYIPVWDREIDIIMLTHADSDHVSGLIDVISRYSVNEVLLAPVGITTSAYNSFLEKLSVYKIVPKTFARGTTLKLSDGLVLVGLWPQMKHSAETQTNESSQVAYLQYKLFSGLLTGDIDTRIASQLEKYNDLPDVDYLKVPHHGSRFNFKLQQLEKLSPLISTVSVGENNNYGHPSPRTMDDLASVGSRVYQTSNDGSICITINLSGVSVSSE